MGGMVAATFLAVFFVPLFFVLIQRMVDGVRKLLGIEPGPHDSSTPIKSSAAAESSH